MELALLGILAAIVCLFFRNDWTLHIRLSFIDDDDLWPTSYERLPPYGQMLFHPKHWHRWTKAQWMRYTKSKTQPR